MSSISAPSVLDTEKTIVKIFTLNPSQVAATYDLATASGGSILVETAVPYVGTAVTGLTTLAIQTNNTTPVVVLAATAAAALTSDLNMTPLTTRFVIPSGKKIQYTIVGTGTGGTMQLIVTYRRTVAGADLV